MCILKIYPWVAPLKSVLGGVFLSDIVFTSLQD
jgi:hypothetical protein